MCLSLSWRLQYDTHFIPSLGLPAYTNPPAFLLSPFIAISWSHNTSRVLCAPPSIICLLPPVNYNPGSCVFRIANTSAGLFTLTTLLQVFVFIKAVSPPAAYK